MTVAIGGAKGTVFCGLEAMRGGALPNVSPHVCCETENGCGTPPATATGRMVPGVPRHALVDKAAQIARLALSDVPPARASRVGRPNRAKTYGKNREH
jgi:hypothetical protein